MKKLLIIAAGAAVAVAGLGLLAYKKIIPDIKKKEEEDKIAINYFKEGSAILNKIIQEVETEGPLNGPRATELLNEYSAWVERAPEEVKNKKFYTEFLNAFEDFKNFRVRVRV